MWKGKGRECSKKKNGSKPQVKSCLLENRVWKQPGNLPILRNIVVENNEKVELEGHKGESPQERILFLLKGKRDRSDKRLKI